MYDDWDTKQVWNLFEDLNNKYFNIPTVEEMTEVHNLLTKGEKEMYAVDFDDCEQKIFYWHKVHDVYSAYKFVMPYNHRLGKQIKFNEIWDYYITPDEISMVEDILKILREISDDYFRKEHISYG